MTHPLYTTEFFAYEAGYSAPSARVILPMVFAHFHPKTMIDVGCGAGEWVREARRLGVDAVGVDGPWSPDPDAIKHDLERALPASVMARRYDLAVCLETVEHLPASRSCGIVSELCALAPVVLFSAAVPGQCGEGHVNEQPDEYWAWRFAQCGRTAEPWITRALGDHSFLPSPYRNNTRIYSTRKRPAAVYNAGNLVITLRCNGACRNCIRLCCSSEWSGFDDSGTDMTEAQWMRAIDDIERVADKTGRPTFEVLAISGGEMTMHPEWQRFAEIAIERLEAKAVNRVCLNTNRTGHIPEHLQSRVVSWWDIGDEKAQNHTAMFIDPAERGYCITRGTCLHHRKRFSACNCYGWMQCCGAEGYIRLFGAEDLILDHLPTSHADWPDMDRICAHCAFAARHEVFERDVGRPISRVYQEQAALNKAGRRIGKRYGQ